MKNGKEYQIAVGGIASDGAGSVRAYNHRITGTQHALIVFSLQTGKPLWVKIDQTSCNRCQRKFTKVLQNSGKKACDLNNIDLSHYGHCYRNSKYSPAQAEEYPCAEAGQFFLCDEATNDFNASDEAFFVAKMVTDGDTPEAIKLFKAQEELLTKPYNITLPREP
jgi:hypothetical protein